MPAKRQFGTIVLKMFMLILLASLNESSDAEGEIPNQTKGKHHLINASKSTTTVTSLISNIHGVRQLREIPEAMLDPYSVLGVLSFSVYIFYILYSRYRMRGHHTPSPGNNNNPQQQQGGATLFNLDAQENFANILKMATKIISSASYLGNSNSTLDSDDYFDSADSSDLRSNKKQSRK